METSADPSPAASHGAPGPAAARLGSQDVNARFWPKATAWQPSKGPRTCCLPVIRGLNPTAALKGARGSDSDFFVLCSLVTFEERQV